MFNDKRKSHRRPMRYTAWIAEKGKPLHGCAVADISSSGARLHVEDIDSIPDEFMLVLSKRGDAQRKCRVVWRKPRQIGVEFANSRTAKVNATLKAFA
jgi:hypothetical protein